MTIYTAVHRTLARKLHPHTDGNARTTVGVSAAAGALINASTDRYVADRLVAAQLREAGFHQAGHLYAARLLGCDVGTRTLNGPRSEPIQVIDAWERRRLASGGILAAAAYPFADRNLESTGAIDAQDFNYDEVMERLGSVTRCDWVDDSAAEDEFCSTAWMLDTLEGLVLGWRRVHTIAVRLIDGAAVDAAFIEQVMSRPGLVAVATAAERRVARYGPTHGYVDDF